MRKKLRKESKLDKILDIPKEVSTETPKVTVVGFSEILIQNHKGILEYEEYFIRLITLIGNININGFNLKIDEMTPDDLKITGTIDSVDFEEITDE